jgi:hypothetical protein
MLTLQLLTEELGESRYLPHPAYWVWHSSLHFEFIPGGREVYCKVLSVADPGRGSGFE